MKPEILINWILEGRIYDVVPSSGDYAEDGRYVWPKRMQTIVQWAKDAKDSAVQADATGSIECMTRGCGECGAEACWDRRNLPLK